MLKFDHKNPELSRTCISLMNKRKFNTLSQEDLEVELYYVAIKYCLNDLCYKNENEHSLAAMAYLSMDRKQRGDFQKENSGAFFEINDELEANQKINNFNYRNKKYLQEMITYFNKIKDKISEEKCFKSLLTHKGKEK